MEKKALEDVPHDYLAAQIQELLDRGLIQRNSPGYHVARALIESTWKDLSEKDRAVFNLHIKPLVEDQGAGKNEPIG